MLQSPSAPYRVSAHYREIHVPNFYRVFSTTNCTIKVAHLVVEVTNQNIFASLTCNFALAKTMSGASCAVLMPCFAFTQIVFS